jgi:hypothetical protein
VVAEAFEPRKSYVKTAESGNKRLHAFCGNCGTPIYACAVDNPQSYGLRVGTMTQRAAFTPQRQGWRRSALHWVDALAAVPATEKGWAGERNASRSGAAGRNVVVADLAS